MRGILFVCAAAAFSLMLGGATAETRADRGGDGSERVLRVDTRGGGPVHKRLTLALDKAAIIELDADARDVLVSDPAVVDAVIRAPRRIFLLAQKIGEANAFFFDAQGRQLLSVDVRVEKDVGDLAGMLREEIPGSNVTVDSLNGNVV